MKCPKIEPIDFEGEKCCKPLIQGIDCFFDPATKKVYDNHNNLIGYGKIEDGFLIVTPIIN